MVMGWVGGIYVKGEGGKEEEGEKGGEGRQGKGEG